MVVTMKMTFFWDVTLCGQVDYLDSEEFTASIIRMENGGSRFLQNISNDLSDYMVSSQKKVSSCNIFHHNMIL